MLSPVPFRICCIAAMAPALTEAASQAESFSLPHSPASSSVCGNGHPASPPSDPYRHKGRDKLKGNLWDTVSLAALANVKLFRLRESQAPAHCAAHAAVAAAMNRVNMGLTNGGSPLLLPPDRAEPRVEAPSLEPASPELLELARTRRGLLERRAERLERRLRRLQLRQAVQHSAGQMAAFFEHQQTSLGLPCLMPQRLLHRKLRDSADIKAELLLQSEDVKSLSTAALVSLVRKLEESHGPAPADLRLGAEDRAEGERVAASLRATLAYQERAVDSDATESSSGGDDSGDDDEPSSRAGADDTLPPAGESTLRQSAAWRWSMDRAAVACRWTWLQAQVADLEFRIRQQADLCRQLRKAKGDVRLEGQDPPEDASTDDKAECDVETTTVAEEDVAPHAADAAGTAAPPAKPNGLVLSASDLLPPAATAVGCARTRALAAGFRKRKVVVAATALASARKSARLTATVQCPCRSVCGPTSPGATAAGWGSGFAASAPPSPVTTVPLAPAADGGAAVDAPTVSLPPLAPCLVCGGRYNSVRPLDAELMTRQEKVALLDPGFHPVLSFPADIPLKLHFEMLLRTGELQKLALKASATLRKKSRLAQVTGLTVDQARKKSRKLAHNAAQTLLSSAKMRRHHSDKKRPYRRHLDGEVTTNESCYDGSFRRADGSFSLSSKQRERQRTFSTASSGSSKAASPVPSPAPSQGDLSNSQLLPGGGAAQSRSILQEVLRKRRGENAFDINNIVIPYSIASATRVERLPYKEILTPKWRALTEEELSGALQDCGDDLKDEVEDMTDEAFEARHQVCEEEEKQRFAGLLSKAVLSGSQAKVQPASGGPQAPPHHGSNATPCHRQLYDSIECSMSPPPTGLSCWAPCEVDPYEPRTFPLADEEYEGMVAESPHLLPSPASSPPPADRDGSPPPLEAAPLEPPEPQPNPEPAVEPDPGGLTFDPDAYLVPKEGVHPEPPISPVECSSVASVPNDDPEWTSETRENLVLKLTKR
ncbi:non-specific lethal 1 [Dermacentor variabilis]|uniref:non-specific lethal 1 n=1 Tax=Dermacentor variabilis TaxID=34621 RepID=UPI003F5B30A9